MNGGDAYSELVDRFNRLGHLRGAAEMLQWDMAAMMPEGGAAARAEQLVALEQACHDIVTAPDMCDLLQSAEPDVDQPDITAWQNANLREMQRQWLHASAVPVDLVAALSRAASHCEMTWREARAENDFALLAPGLADLVSLVRRSAEASGEALGCEPYDALLDLYEPGMSRAEIDPLFDDLEGFLGDLLPRVLDAQKNHPVMSLPGDYPEESQRDLGKRFMSALGFDFNHGRLDVSHHPFTAGVPDDVRITTRYSRDDFTRALMGVLHETGHALYERGLPTDWHHQPVGQARGMALHESQSLLVEMQLCRGADFLSYAIPLMRESFRGASTGSDAAWGNDNLKRLYLQVEPGFIRVDADEVTYPLHVMLRYRIEQALLSGDLPVADLPTAWNEAMRDMLGLKVTQDSLGCLQDIHWPGGSFGYFPTYTLGALAAAQIFAAAREALPDFSASISAGEFAPLIGWLKENIHQPGSLYSTDELLEKATGSPLGTAAFKSHLQRRYLSDEMA